MAPSANTGRALWPKKAKTHEINAMVTKKPSSSFDIFTAYPPSFSARKHIFQAKPILSECDGY